MILCDFSAPSTFAPPSSFQVIPIAAAEDQPHSAEQYGPSLTPVPLVIFAPETPTIPCKVSIRYTENLNCFNFVLFCIKIIPSLTGYVTTQTQPVNQSIETSRRTTTFASEDTPKGNFL